VGVTVGVRAGEDDAVNFGSDQCEAARQFACEGQGKEGKESELECVGGLYGKESQN